MYGHIDVVDILVTNGSDINHINNDGDSALTLGL